MFHVSCRMDKIRYSGVAWLGDIPDGWEVSFLAQVVSQVKERNVGLREKNLLSLSYGKIKRKPIDTIGGLLPATFDGYNVIAANDIVLRLTDLQNDQHSLRVGLSHEQGIITSAYITLPRDLLIFSSPTSIHGCPNTCFGNGSSSAISIIGQ